MLGGVHRSSNCSPYSRHLALRRSPRQQCRHGPTKSPSRVSTPGSFRRPASMQIWRNPSGCTAARGSLGGWLAVVARNRSIDALRRRRPAVNLDDIALASPCNFADEALRRPLAERARTAILQLPREQRKTFEMAFFDGLTHSETAEMTRSEEHTSELQSLRHLVCRL